MGTIHGMFIRMKEFDSSLIDIIDKIGEEYKEEIASLNREQLSKGLTSDNEKIGDKEPFNYPKYFDQHEKHRKENGLQTNFIDLKWKGTFHESIFAEIKSNRYSLLSSDNQQKVSALMYGGGESTFSICGCRSVREGGFGENILGLTPDNAADITNKATERFVQYMKEKLML